MASGTINMTQPNNIGTMVTIPIGTTYTCPSDGYLFVFCAYNANAYARADICDQDGNVVVRVQASNSGSNSAGITSIPVFVRRGTKLKAMAATNDGYIAFYPIV